MKDSSKFLQLRDLASDLNDKLERLLNGTLPLKELEQLTDESRELYERLVVLRFKAFDAEVKGTTNVVHETEEEKAPIHFQIEEPSIAEEIIEETKPEAPIQVSLIDAIEEVTRTEGATEQVPFVISQPAIEEIETTTAPAVNLFQNRESLHDKLSKTIGSTESLAQKLEHNPIDDLKRAISLNQRFQFSKELFKGNNQDYEVAIDKLNTASRDEAMNHLESLRKKYSWSEESAVASDFVGLVERRHQ